MNESNEHSWFNDAIDAYLAGGLSADEARQFESHASQCESCASELQSAGKLEHQMSTLFAASIPALDFADRLIARLRHSAPRLRIHPAIKRAAITAAAIAFVGGIGYVGNEQMKRGSLPGFALSQPRRAVTTPNGMLARCFG